jgi:hypothetical protein
MAQYRQNRLRCKRFSRLGKKWLERRRTTEPSTCGASSLLDPVFVSKNEVRRARELDAACDQGIVALVDVAHAQMEHRFLPGRICCLEKEARPSTIEEGELTESVQVLQSEHVTIPSA